MHRSLLPPALSALTLALVLGPVSPAAAVPVDPAPPAAASAEAPAPLPEAARTTDRVIVKYKDESTASRTAPVEALVEEAAQAVDVPEASEATRINTVLDGAAVVELSGEVSASEVEKLTEEIEADPAVVYAEPDRRVFTATTPGTTLEQPTPAEQLAHAAAAAQDPYAGSMWALTNLRAYEAWDTATGKGVNIGIVDTGIANHPDLDPKILDDFDFVSSVALSNDNDGRDSDGRDPGTFSRYGQCYEKSPASKSIWHGTHVAGSAAAARNAYATVGIAPDARILNARALGACGTGYVSDMAAAVYWLAGESVVGAPKVKDLADVINMSLSMWGTCPPLLQDAINTAWSRGIPVVVAAGNNWGAQAINYAPGNCYNVITTGAITSTRGTGGPVVAGYSNVGAAVDIYAPGDYIHSSGNSGTEGPVSANVRIDYGTSMASPHVAATVALLRQKNPALTSDQLKAKILDSGDPWGSLGGAKTLNAHDALYITNFFQDVPWGTQFYEEIEWARASSISTGWTSGSTRLYQPTVAINRDAMAAFLYRMAGSPAYTPPKVSPFKDVATTQKFYKEMAWLKSQGISTGYSNGTYRPLQPINRDAMAAFLYRMAGSPAYAAPTASPFQDVVRGQQFYKEMAWMKSTEISTGFSDGTYRALNHVNRDAMAAFLYRLAPLV